MNGHAPSTALPVALITGAAQGIGRAVALRLSADGFVVALLDLPTQDAELRKVLEEITEKRTSNGIKPQAIMVHADISSEEEVIRAVNATISKLGTIDVLVANAGIMTKPCHFVDATVESLDAVMQVNVKGTFLTFREVAKHMISRGKGGKLIASASCVAMKGVGILTEYTASKWAIRGIVQCAASSLAHHGITANAYSPGPVDTHFWEFAKPHVASLTGVKPEEVWKLFPIPLNRPAVPDDIANIVSFLASKNSDYMTGQTMNIDGGMNFS